jgi:hypothetical protein
MLKVLMTVACLTPTLTCRVASACFQDALRCLRVGRKLFTELRRYTRARCNLFEALSADWSSRFQTEICGARM